MFCCTGTDVYTSSKADDCWAALVVTPIMRRAQSLESAQELIFVDSTASCDTTRSTVTVLLTATKAGAVPIAVLIHSSQSREGYSLAFQLLKHCYPTCFGNREAPAAFMSDSSRPEKDALRDVWPSAQQVLCHFHILQAEWRWITSSHHKVDKDDRRRFMAAFQKVLYSKTKEELEEAKAALRSLPHQDYVQRVDSLLKTEEEWVAMYRAGIVTRGQNTNNYSEASIRILKDIVLCRTKAYNAVALVEYITTAWEKYFETRILRHAHNRESAHRNSIDRLLDKIPDMATESIVQNHDEGYSVPNSAGTGMYEVHADIGVCSCWAGSQGAFCKHQALVQRAFGVSFPNSPQLTPADCVQLGQLALVCKTQNTTKAPAAVINQWIRRMRQVLSHV
ncbi:uncharacterized protein LOC144123039 [Amblyomma americanum]